MMIWVDRLAYGWMYRRKESKNKADTHTLSGAYCTYYRTTGKITYVPTLQIANCVGRVYTMLSGSILYMLRTQYMLFEGAQYVGSTLLLHTASFKMTQGSTAFNAEGKFSAKRRYL